MQTPLGSWAPLVSLTLLWRGTKLHLGAADH